VIEARANARPPVRLPTVRTKRILIFAAVMTGTLGSIPMSAAAKPPGNGRPADGLYAGKANPKLPYSNGGVDLQVASGGRKIVFPSGVACYTGPNPPAGVPAYDEVSIHLPRSLAIGSGNSFSFSGAVTLSAEEAQAESTITTTYTIKGRFVKGKHGAYAAVGSDSSPICQPSTEKHFSLEFAPGE
jgi:hypothetical protein